MSMGTYTEAEARALAQAAAAAMRERAAAAAQTVADDGTPDHRVRMAAIAVRDTIRALPLPTPDLDAIRAQARREGMDVGFDLGFGASCEGWNGEYGASIKDDYYLTRKDAAIRAAMGGGDE